MEKYAYTIQIIGDDLLKFKNLKRILALTLMVTMISSSMVFAEEGNIESTKTDVSSSSSLSDKEIAINNLLNGGWTMSEIKDLISDSELTKYTNLKPVKSVTKFLKLVQKKKDVKESKIKSKQSIQNTEIDEDTEFVAISEEQCKFELEQIKANKSNSDGYVKLSDTMSNTGMLNLTPLDGSRDSNSSDGYLTYTISAWSQGGGKYLINYRWEWLKDPLYTSIDVFGLAHDPGLIRSVNDPTTYVYKYDYFFNGFATEYQENSPESMNPDTGGVVFSTNLKNSDTAMVGTTVSWYGHHRGYTSYYVNKQSSGITHAYIYGCYKHLERTAEPSVSIGWPLNATLSVTPSEKYVTETPNAELDFAC